MNPFYCRAPSKCLSRSYRKNCFRSIGFYDKELCFGFWNLYKEFSQIFGKLISFFFLDGYVSSHWMHYFHPIDYFYDRGFVKGFPGTTEKNNLPHFLPIELIFLSLMYGFLLIDSFPLIDKFLLIGCTDFFQLGLLYDRELCIWFFYRRNKEFGQHFFCRLTSFFSLYA